MSFLILGSAVVSSLAQTPGVTENSSLIGSCSALDGPARFLVNQTVMGATAYLHGINDEGGVFGRKIQLLAFDDGYDPDRAAACFKRMTKEDVFSLGFFVATPTRQGLCAHGTGREDSGGGTVYRGAAPLRTAQALHH